MRLMSAWDSQSYLPCRNTVAGGNETKFRCSVWILCPRLKFFWYPLMALISEKKLATNRKTWNQWTKFQFCCIFDIQVPLGTPLLGGFMDQMLSILMVF